MMKLYPNKETLLWKNLLKSGYKYPNTFLALKE